MTVGVIAGRRNHSDGTEEWMAFLKDCDGKLLALMSQKKPA